MFKVSYPEYDHAQIYAHTASCLILISVYVKIQSFGVCLQINCLVIHKGPSILNFGLIFFNWDSITGSGLGLVILHKMSPRTHHINYF